MVDVTFIFVVLLGGALVGFVTAMVRGHAGWRKALDILGGTLGGFAGTPLWLALVQHVIPRMVGPVAEMSPTTGAMLSNLYYFSPVLGGFLGVAIVALVYRVVLGKQNAEPWPVTAGQVVQIAGIVYFTVAVCLTSRSSRWRPLMPAGISSIRRRSCSISRSARRSSSPAGASPTPRAAPVPERRRSHSISLIASRHE